MNLTYDWHFPLPRTHTGMLQGNGVMGVMIWGGGNQLNLTIGRADFWDRRGGKPWTDRMNYQQIRKLLESGDEKTLRDIFKEEAPGPGQPKRPSVLPIGRFELVFPEEFQITTGTLELGTAQIVIDLRDKAGTEHAITLNLAINEPILNVNIPSDIPLPK